MRCIELTRGQRAVVDDEDYTELSKFKWYANKTQTRIGTTWYASRQYRDPVIKNKHGKGKQILVLMHRQIMGDPEGKVVDHRNGNTLDNQKTNLRPTTNQKNLWNQGWVATPNKPYKGVYKYHSRSHQGWKVGIQLNGKPVSLGWFKDPKAAAKAYDAVALAAFGEYARLNFPEKNCTQTE